MPGNGPALVSKARRANAHSSWLLELAPRVAELPAPIQKHDDPFLPYCRAVFAATEGYAAGYVFDLAAFLALGAAGAVALERAVAVVAATPALLAVIHGPFARPEYALFAGEAALRADAATVTDPAVAAAFAVHGVAGLVVTDAPDSTVDSVNLEAGRARLAGLDFRIARQSYLNRFQREDFQTALREAAERGYGA